MKANNATNTDLLTPQQRSFADALRLVRPAVLPGTRVVVDEKLRNAWFELCTYWADSVGVTTRNSTEFFDRAGVPD